MLSSYLKIAIKVLLRRKFFTFISLFCVGFTMIVLITAAAFYEHSYSPQRPESKADRFLALYRARFTSSENPGREWSSLPGYKFLDRYVRDLPGIEYLSIHSEPSRVVAFREGRKLEIMLKHTDGAFWDVMDFQFTEGGPYTNSDEQNRIFTAVINEAMRDLYFGKTGVVGEAIEVDGQTFRVAGVVRNVAEYRRFPYADVWVPITTRPTDLYRDLVLDEFYGTILAKSKQDIPRIKAALKQKLADVPSPRPETYDTFQTMADTYLETWARDFGGNWSNWDEKPGVAKALLGAAGVVLLFMLLPAVNLINLNVSRIMERAGEIGVRKAFGATSRALTWQFLVENLVLTLLGALLGLIGGALVLAFINGGHFIPYARLQINFNVFLMALVAALVFGVFSGVYPAWRMSKTHPAIALKGGIR